MLFTKRCTEILEGAFCIAAYSEHNLSEEDYKDLAVAQRKHAEAYVKKHNAENPNNKLKSVEIADKNRKFIASIELEYAPVNNKFLGTVARTFAQNYLNNRAAAAIQDKFQEVEAMYKFFN